MSLRSTGDRIDMLYAKDEDEGRRTRMTESPELTRVREEMVLRDRDPVITPFGRFHLRIGLKDNKQWLRSSHEKKLHTIAKPGSHDSMVSSHLDSGQPFREASEIMLSWQPTGHASYVLPAKHAGKAGALQVDDELQRTEQNEIEDPDKQAADALRSEPEKDANKEDDQLASARTKTPMKRDMIENVTSDALQAYLHTAEDRVCSKMRISLQDAIHETAEQIFKHRQKSQQKLKQTIILESHRNVVRHNISMLKNIHERIWDEMNSSIEEYVERTCSKSRYTVL
ncbi:hypothetical protein GUITHDRAFT_109625 [Guillardia theta CCMP2712]|uniref:Uncharacterized protein n=1 Tax=Guillardia theta (strain CCMP2712) TaxID=905079 RepID=L1J8V8_GUITC|nr:hypothetical protein GUITHDRAFT_109625 [Guillardia theta CCMP2712]EKX44505.1 hypothetical protein GUITHDRAFT_109625 [Guillardia theta CCMP2712]|eukprot:XP_005831485.1 hypothetical protein GUITHDRAFT_109625 [Guillardia theta CCMP2712]